MEHIYLLESITLKSSGEKQNEEMIDKIMAEGVCAEEQLTANVGQFWTYYVLSIVDQSN